MQDQVYCGVCEVIIEENFNFKDFKYVHKPTGEVWCDGCTFEREI